MNKCKNCKFYQHLPSYTKVYFYRYPFYELRHKIIMIFDSPLPIYLRNTLQNFIKSINQKDVGIFFLTNCFVKSKARLKNVKEIKECCKNEVDFDIFKKDKYLLLFGANTKKVFNINRATVNFAVYDYGESSKIITLPLFSYFLQDFFNNIKRSLRVLTPPQEYHFNLVRYSPEVINKLRKAEKICLDIETEGTVNPYHPFKITHISMTSPDIFPNILLLKDEEEIQSIKDIIADKTKRFIGFNINFDLVHLFRYFNISPQEIINYKIDDVMLMYYCFNEEVKINIGSASLKSIAINELNVKEYAEPMNEFKKTLKEYQLYKSRWETKYKDLPILNKAAEKCKEKLEALEQRLKELSTELDNYSCLDTLYTYLLYQIFKPEIDKHYRSLYNFIVSASKYLTAVVANGMYIDINQIAKLKEKYEKMIEDVEKLFRDKFNITDINLNSEHQLTELLRDKIKNPVKTKTNLISFTEPTLEQYKSDNPEYADIFEALKQYKYAQKMLNTYIKNFMELKDENNLLHGDFSVIGTETGRVSSRGLLHQLPRDEIRSVFTSRFGDDGLFLSADYKQMELRVAALLSGDKELIKDLSTSDPYKEFIAYVLKKPVAEITKAERGIGKAVILGTLYGITEYGISRQLNIPIDQSRKLLNMFYEKYSTYKQWKDSIIQKIHTDCELVYSIGRHRRFPQFLYPQFINRRLRYRLYNSAVNAPVQGTASDITLINLIRLYRAFVRHNLKSKIINVVHDSILIDVYKPELDIVIKLLKEITAFIPKKWIGGYSASIPIEISVGKDYYNVKEIS